MVGLFINTLPVRVRIARGRAPALPWLQALQAQQLELRQYEHTPLVAGPGLERGASRRRRSSSRCSSSRTTPSTRRCRGSACLAPGAGRPGRTSAPTTRSRSRSSPAGRCACAPSTTRPASSPPMQRLLEHWRNAAGAPWPPPRRLDDVSLAHRGRAPAGARASGTTPRADFPADSCIHQLFEQQVALRPDAVAVESGDARAHLPRARRSAPTSSPTCCAPRASARRRSWPCAWSARWSSSSPCWPSSRPAAPTSRWTPSYPAQRLAFMLEDAPSPAPAHLSRPALAAARPRGPGRLALRARSCEPRRLPTLRRGLAASPLATWPTSSSPRAPPAGPRAWPSSTAPSCDSAMASTTRTSGPRRRFLLIAPISFDASTLEVWGPLLFGGAPRRLPAAVAASDLELLSQVLTRHRVTALHLTAGLFSPAGGAQARGPARPAPVAHRW